MRCVMDSRQTVTDLDLQTYDNQLGLKSSRTNWHVMVVSSVNDAQPARRNLNTILPFSSDVQTML